MLARLFTIAANTFLEAVRQKFFNALLLLAAALVVSARFFQQFDFGTGELKFITDFGFGALFVFGVVLSICSTAQLFFNELENRTALTMLAKPVRKIEFLAGKWLGVQMVLLVFIFSLCAVLAAVLWWREGSILARLALEGNTSDPLIRYGDIFLFGFLQWIKFGILASITLCIGSFSNTNLYTIVVSFFALVICQLQYIARDAYAETASGILPWLIALTARAFPNFQLFNVGDRMVLVGNEALPLITVLQITLYGLFYAMLFISLALLHFRRRQF